MKKFIYLLFKRIFWDCPDFKFSNRRRSGNTTRQVDSSIQWLFRHRGQYLSVRDHYGSRESSELLLRKIVQRLKAEHGLTTGERHTIDTERVVVLPNRLLIKITPL